MTPSTRRPLGIWATALALALAAPAAGQSLYDAGRQDWLAALYPQAYPPLFSYRASPYGRTAEVDYMLGTSGCRMDGRRVWGARVLNYILYSYALSNDSRRQVIAERDLCRSPQVALAPAGRSAMDAMIATGATASARGKLYYEIPHGDTKPAAAYPAHRVREIPAADLAARRVPLGQPGRIRAVLAPLAPEGASVHVVGRFALVVAAGQTDAELARLGDILEAYVGFLHRAYGMAPPDHYITLYLMPDTGSLRTLANRLHGLDVSPAALGYTYQADLSTVAVIRGDQAGTALHEMFHLLVRGNFGDVPQWLDEGTASLYEVSARRGDRYVGLPNWRGGVLRAFGYESPTLGAMIASPWFSFDRADQIGTAQAWDSEFSGDRAAAHMATARYFALYLQDRGRLGEVYKAFQARDPGAADDPGAAAVALVERTLGEPMPTTQASYDLWLKSALNGDMTNAPGTIGKTLPKS